MTATPSLTEFTSARAFFPALNRVGADGHPVIYADAPGGTQVPTQVIDAMVDYLTSHNSNIEGEFDATRETDEIIEASRIAAAAFVNGHKDEIAFGQNMTSLNFNLTRAFGRTLSAGDEILVTQLDHEANVSPWLLLAADRNLVVRTVGLTGDLDIDMNQLTEMMSTRTKVIAHTLSSNAVGTLPPAREIASLAHAAGAAVWVDAVAYAPHRRINVEELDCDVLLCSPYKFFGPHLGMAWLRQTFAETLQAERVRPASMTPLGHRFETGTLSHEAISGTTAAIEYLASLGNGPDLVSRLDSAFALIGEHEDALTQRFLDGLDRISGITLFGTRDIARRVCTFGLSIDGVNPTQAAQALNDHGIYAWNGNFYAQGVMEYLGLPLDEGILRVGFVHYATPEEIDRVLEVLGFISGGVK